MRRIITTKVIFAAAHQLPELGPDHKCSRLHGHTYVVEVDIETGELDAKGMVLDFGEVKNIIRRADHRLLNTVINPGATAVWDDITQCLHFVPAEGKKLLPASAEVLAQWVWDALDFALLEPLNRETQNANHKVYIRRVSVDEGGDGTNVTTLMGGSVK